MKKIIFLFALSLLVRASYSQTEYVFDKNHARLSFSAVHFGISHVEGNFKNFDVTLKASKEDFTDAAIELITAKVPAVLVAKFT